MMALNNVFCMIHNYVYAGRTCVKMPYDWRIIMVCSHCLDRQEVVA